MVIALTPCMLSSNVPALINPAEESSKSAMPESCKRPETRFDKPVCSAKNQRLIDQAKSLEAQAQQQRKDAQMSAEMADDSMANAQSLREQAQSGMPVF